MRAARVARAARRTGATADTIALASVSAFAVLALARLALGPRGPVLAFIAALDRVPLVATAAGVFAWRAGAAPGLRASARRGWRLMAAAHIPMLLWSATASSAVAALRAAWPAWTTAWMDWAMLGFYPLAFASLVTFSATARARQCGRFVLDRFVLDGATVAIAGATLAWYIVGAPAARAGVTGIVEALAYVVGDFVLLAGVVRLTLRRPDETSASGASPLALQVLALAGGVAIGADFLYAAQCLRGVFAARALTAALWLTASWIMALAGYVQRWATAPGRAVGARRDDAAPAQRSHPLLPYAGVAAVYVALLSNVRASGSGALALVFGAGVLTALALVRQAVATREHAALEATRVAERLAREARFRSLVQHSSDVIAVLDARGRITFVSPSVARVFAAEPDALLGVRLLALAHPADRRAVARLLGAPDVAPTLLAPSEIAPTVVTWRVHHPTLGWRHVETVATNRLDDPAVGGVVLNSRDLTERVELETQLTRQAYADPLTGLANRARLRDRLAHALARRTRGSVAAPATALLLLDLDGFKAVNDTFGHLAGDALLCQVAERLLNATRGCDTVARLGGDEFAVLLEHAHAAGGVATVAERVLAAMAHPFWIDGQAARVGASIGVAHADVGRDGDALLRDADAAMYAAKRAGKGRYAVAGAADAVPAGLRTIS